MMQKTFVQTFMFECEERTQPLGYEFEIIGEVTTSLSGDSSSADEVFEVVQNQPLKFNPGRYSLPFLPSTLSNIEHRKRIAAVQRTTICVDAYLGAMSVSCCKVFSFFFFSFYFLFFFLIFTFLSEGRKATFDELRDDRPSTKWAWMGSCRS